MNKLFLGSLVVLVGVLALSLVVFNKEESSTEKLASVKVHSSPDCGCCDVWGRYMINQGYQVDSNKRQDLTTVKKELGVPRDLFSCHTSEIEGYVVEGHIPTEAIEKLLENRPDIKGIGMPGMPSGSPGMPGAKTGDFVIYEITHDGQRGEEFLVI